MTVATVDNPTLTTSRSDADDVALAANGDRLAFERVYRTHVNRVFAVCARMVADRSVAEELTQDVFVRAWSKIGVLIELGRISVTSTGARACSSSMRMVSVNPLIACFEAT